MTERKATDVILDLETKIQRLTGICQNLDNNTKIILDRLNKITAKLELLPKKPFIAESIAESSNIFVARPINDSTLAPGDKDELQVEIMPKGTRRDLRTPKPESPSQKIAVSQQILYADNNPVILAGVEVFNQDGILVKQTRTNNKGRWVIPLEPGNYNVHILKRANDVVKTPVELRYSINIPNIQGPLEIPPPEIRCKT